MTQKFHLNPDPALADQLARSWSDGFSSGTGAERDRACPDQALRVKPGHASRHQHSRGILLKLRYTAPERFRKLLASEPPAAPWGSFDLSPGDLALLHGGQTAAVAAYRSEIRAGSLSAVPWAGLITAARTADEDDGWQTLLHWAPLAFAVHARVTNADPLELTAWLAEACPRRQEL